LCDLQEIPQVDESRVCVRRAERKDSDDGYKEYNTIVTSGERRRSLDERQIKNAEQVSDRPTITRMKFQKFRACRQ